MVRVDHNYFETLEIPLIAGRALESGDSRSASWVGVINETFAVALFGDRNPVGKVIRIGDGPGLIEIVGISGDVKFRNLRQAAPSVLYMSIRQAPPGGAVQTDAKLQVRSRMTSQEVAAVVREHIRERSIRLAVGRASTFETDIGASYADERLRMQAAGVLGGVALLLVGTALYGMIVFTVIRRTPEIGMRIALGATPFSTFGLVLTDSLKLVGIGVLSGLPAAVAVMLVLSGLSSDLWSIDIGSLIGAVVVLVLTGVVAAVGPAFRAVRVDPVESLRTQ